MANDLACDALAMHQTDLSNKTAHKQLLCICGFTRHLISTKTLDELRAVLTEAQLCGIYASSTAHAGAVAAYWERKWRQVAEWHSAFLRNGYEMIIVLMRHSSTLHSRYLPTAMHW